jgi:hypothetical protein
MFSIPSHAIFITSGAELKDNVFFILQECNSNADNILLHPGRFYILLGTSDFTHKMAVQACAQCSS